MKKEKEMFEVVCDNCGNIFKKDKSAYHRLLKHKHHFCSTECRFAFQKTGSIIKCENCGKEFYITKRVLESSEHHYCSVKCAHTCIGHSHPHSDETKEKIRQGVLKHNEEHGYTKPALTEEQKRNIVEKRKETWDRKLLESNWDDLGYEAKKTRVYLEQNGKCARCGFDIWMGEKLILEYEHKDGNHSNNARDNVECLCPNCHSLTSTWRGRNCKKFGKKEKRSDEEIVNAFIEEGNIHRTLKKLGMAQKGANYARIRRILHSYGIKDF